MHRSIFLVLCLSIAFVYGFNSLPKVKSPKLNPLGIIVNPESCNNDEPDPNCSTLKEVRVHNCTVQPCVWIPGTEYSIDVDFLAKNNSTDVHLLVQEIIFGVTFDRFKGNLGMSTEPGKPYTINYIAGITEQYRGWTYIYRLELTGLPSNNVEFCVRFNVTVPAA